MLPQPVGSGFRSTINFEDVHVRMWQEHDVVDSLARHHPIRGVQFDVHLVIGRVDDRGAAAPNLTVAQVRAERAAQRAMTSTSAVADNAVSRSAVRRQHLCPRPNSPRGRHPRWQHLGRPEQVKRP